MKTRVHLGVFSVVCALLGAWLILPLIIQRSETLSSHLQRSDELMIASLQSPAVFVALATLVSFLVARSVLLRSYRTKMEHLAFCRTQAADLRTQTQEFHKIRSDIAQRKDSLAMYSHEIRTPLNVILAMSRTLRASELGLERETAMLQYASQSLLATASNVLDVSAIEAKAIRCEQVAFDLNNIIESLSETAATACSHKALVYEFQRVGKALPAVLEGDGLRVQQVLYNLIDNAVRHAEPDSSVLFRIETQEMQGPDGDEIMVKFVVVNRGISAEDPLHSPAAQTLAALDQSTAPCVRMGLYITRKLVRAMRGTIVIDQVAADPSERTSVWTVTTQLRFRVPPPAPGATSSQDHALHVLIVDDDPMNHAIVKAYLRDKPHKIHSLEDGLKTIDTIASLAPDVILLDAELGDVHGFDIARSIRRNEATATAPCATQRRNSLAPVHLPIIMMSAHQSDEFVLDARRAGCDFVVPKPVDRARLIHYLQQIAQAKSAAIHCPLMRFNIAQPQHDNKQDHLIHSIGSSGSVLRSLEVPTEDDMWTHINLPFLPVLRFSAFVRVILETVVLVCFVEENLRSLSVASVGVALYELLWFARHFWIARGSKFAPFILSLQQVVSCVVGNVAHLHVLATIAPLYLQYAQGVYHTVPKIVTSVCAVASLWVCMTSPVVQSAGVIVTCAVFAMQLSWVALFMFMHFASVRKQSGGLRARLALLETTAVNLQQRLKEKWQGTERLVAGVSYAFRHPLNIVLAVTQKLTDRQDLLAEHSRDSLQAMESASHLLLNYISNMLDHRCIELGTVLHTTKVQRISVRELVHNVVQMLQLHARAKRLYLDQLIDPSVPEAVLGDPVRLMQMLINIVSNSIKFTREGGVRVSVTVEPNEAIAHECLERALRAPPAAYDASPLVRARDARIYSALRFEVKDTGPGMSSETIAKILQEKYVPGAAAGTKQGGGFGLGVHITQAITAHLNGKLSVDSELGKGSAFAVTVPLEVVKRVTGGLRRASLSGELARDLNILSIEDSPEMQYLIRMFLENTPHNLTLAYNGREAKRNIVQGDRPFDVILVDLYLPDAYGLDLIRLVRKHERRARLPSATIILMTAADISSVIAHASEAGADFVEAKPLLRRRFRELLREVACRPLQLRALRSMPIPIPSPLLAAKRTGEPPFASAGTADSDADPLFNVGQQSPPTTPKTVETMVDRLLLSPIGLTPTKPLTAPSLGRI